MAATAATARLVARAASLGLSPQERAPRGSSYQVTLNGTGRDGGFGALVVGRRTGRVARLVLRYGSDDNRPTQHVTHTGYRAAREALEAYATYARTLPGSQPR